MIVKLIRMNRNRASRTLAAAQRGRIREMRQAVFGLTRYIVDADPFSLMEVEHDILSLSDYALAAQSAAVEPGEKVAAHGSRNLVSNDLASWQAQMLAVAARAPRVKSPVLHVILSLKQDESWTAEQREEALDIVLATLDLSNCPVVWAEHCDTNNPHLHLSIIRVNPRTGKVAGSDWLIEDLHQSVALIEERQGRAKEPGALYVAKNGAVYDSDTGTLVRDENGRFQAGWHKSLGRKRSRVSAEIRQRRVELIAAVDRCRTWSEFHQACASCDMTYDKKGSGARITTSHSSCKASEVHPKLSRVNLEKHWGPFEPDIHRLDPQYEAFRYNLDKQLADLRSARDKETEKLATWANTTIATLQLKRREVLRSAIRRETQEARKSLQSAFAEAIKQCTSQRLTLEKWKAAGQPPYKRVPMPSLLLPSNREGAENEWAISGRFATRSDGWSTTYLDERGDELFTDHRIVILVHRDDRVDAIDEALRIGAERWGKISVQGPEAFVKLATERAFALGIPLAGQEGRVPTEITEKDPRASSEKAAVPEPLSSSQIYDQDEIERIIRFLRSHPTLALRRRKKRGDTVETGRRGPLEIVLQTPNSKGKDALFHPDSRVQAVLEELRTETLNSIRSIGPDTDCARSLKPATSILEGLRGDDRLQRAAKVMLGDNDFEELLRQVREKALNRISNRGGTHGQGEAEAGLSAVEMQFFLNGNGGRGED